MQRPRHGLAKGRRVNFPHHNPRAIVLPDQRRPDPDARPAHAIESEVARLRRLEREKEWNDLPPKGPIPLGERGTCPRCGRTKLRIRPDGELYEHTIPSSTEPCSWGRWILPPPSQVSS
jgi:hypothetical protein